MGFYWDGGWSGSNLNRPEMQRMIKIIKEGKINAVVVYKLDRLSRSQRDTIFLLEDIFEKYHVDFISLSENFDTSSPYGKCLVGILSVFAQLERENIRERTRMGMAARVRTGQWRGGGNVPYGYDYIPDLNTLVPNQDAKNVPIIFQLYIQGYSPAKIAEMFGLCNEMLVRNILQRITYIGKQSYKGEILDGIHPALIDEKTFEEAQQEMVRRSHSRANDSKYLLAGLLYCGKCGAKMRYQKWGPKSIKVYCYSQQTTKKNLVSDPNCDNRRIDATQLDQIVINDLFSRVAKIKKNSETKEAILITSGLDIMKSKLNELITRQKRLYNLYGSSGDDVLLETIEEIKAQILKLQEAIKNEEEHEKNSQSNKVSLKMLENLLNNWDKMSDLEKHQAMTVCIDRIVITDGKIEIKYNV